MRKFPRSKRETTEGDCSEAHDVTGTKGGARGESSKGAGGTGPHGTLEGSGNGPGTGTLGGHSNDAPLDGYVSTNGLCVNGTSIP